MELDQIYTEIITENSHSKRNKRELENPTAVIRGVNPIYGDEASLQIREEDGIIEDASFTGIGRAVSQASTLIMTDLIEGKTKGETMHLAEIFLFMIKEDKLDKEAQNELEDAAVFQNISKLSACVKCTVFAWHTLEEAIQSDENCPGDDSASCETRI